MPGESDSDIRQACYSSFSRYETFPACSSNVIGWLAERTEMKAVIQGGAASAWSETQRAEFLSYLELLVAEPIFAASRRRTQLLRYLIDRKLAGDAESVNEYAIGLDVFGKPASFDPRTEATVRVEMSRLRRALAEHYAQAGASDPWRIALPPRGYIPSIEPAATPVPEPVKEAKRFPWWMIAVLGALLIGSFLLFRWTRSAHPQIASVAVLPFANLTGNPQQDYLTDGITEQLTDSLAQITSLRVVARTSAFQFRGKAADIREIGRRLNAEAVVEGSLRSINGMVQLTVQVNRSSDGYHILSQTFAGDMKDLNRLQIQMVQPVLTALRPNLPLAKRHTPAPEAYDLFLRARAIRGLGSKSAFEDAVRYLNQAVQADPNYSEAYAALAGVYASGAMNQGLTPLKYAANAKAAAQNALQLDPSSGEAWAAQGYADAMILLDWSHGEEELRRALALMPQSATGHNWLGVVLLAEGRFQDAISELQTAETLDPLAAAPGATVGLAYYTARRYDEALQKFSLVRDLHPEAIAVRPFIGDAWTAKGEYGKARAEYESVQDRAAAAVRPRLAILLALMGKRQQAIAILRQIEQPQADAPPPNAFDVGVIYGVLGQRDQAFEWLDRAYEQRIIWFLKVHPLLDYVRDDPRYGRLLEKTGLSNEQRRSAFGVTRPPGK